MKKYFLLSVVAFSFFVAHAQIITTIAGNGTNTYGLGDGGPATATGATPWGVAIDSAGNVYFADIESRVRKVNTAGIISTFAGIGSTGYGGDGGPATAASFGEPQGVYLDRKGNMYIGCIDQQVVRKVNTVDTISTIAGQFPPSGLSVDGGPATVAQLQNPVAIAMDNAGSIYIAEYGKNKVRKVDAFGIITTFAGTGYPSYSGDGGTATAAELFYPRDLAVDGAGNVYIADAGNNRIRKVNTSGIITTIAGNGIGGGGLGSYTGDDSAATAAGLFFPDGVAIDAIGNVYIGDCFNNRIRKVNTAGIITTIAGTGATGFGGGGYAGDGGPATAARFNQPNQIRLDCGGNLYIPDESFHVRMITYNHAPFFAKGAVQNLTVCDTATTTLNTLLAAYDIDTLQTAAWSVVVPPAHGTAIAAYTATTTGDTLTPTGLSYKPAKGYIGADTLKIAVTDCGHLSDTTTIYVTVKGCTAGIEPLTSKNELTVYPNPVSDEIHIDGLQSAASYKLLNMVGAVMGAGMLQAGSNNIAVMRLPQGVYILEVNGMEGSRGISRIIKE